MNALPSLDIRDNDILFTQKALLAWPGLSGAARQVGGALINHFNRRSGLCYPSYERIAEVTGLSVGGVRKGVKALVDVGLFQVNRHGGRAATNSYKPNFDTIRQFISDYDRQFFGGEPATGVAHCEDGGEGQPVPSVAHNLPHTGHTTCPVGSNKLFEKPIKRTLREKAPKTSTLRQAENSEPSRHERGARYQPSVCSGRKPSRNEALTRWVATPTVDASTAARSAAERRLDEHFRKIGGGTYTAFVTADSAAHEKAIEAEIVRRGSGIEQITAQLTSPVNAYAEASRGY